MKKFFSVKVLSLLVAMICLLGNITVYAETKNVSNKPNAATMEEAIKKVKKQYINDYNLLTQSDKENELIRISSSYKEGDVLSEKDSAIILLNAQEVKNAPTPLAGMSNQWHDTYKSQYGVSVNMYGSMKQNIAFVAGSSTFGGTSNLHIQSGSVSKVKLEIFHTAYGLIGTTAPYVGVLYSGSVSMSKSSPGVITSMDKELGYGSILPLHTTMYARGTITTSSGDQFTILSNTWKQLH